MNKFKLFLRRFLPVHIKSHYRGWRLFITHAGVVGTRGGRWFILPRLTSIEKVLRAGKADVDRREGVEKWIEGYENEALR